MERGVSKHGLTHHNEKERYGQTEVKFSDVTMTTTTGSRRSMGSMFTRRNKCLVFILFSTIALLIMIMNAGLFTGGPVYTGELCKLSEVAVMEDLDKEKFSGLWYGAYTKAMESPMLAALLEFYDVKVNFVLKDDQNFDLKSVGGKFFGMWCPEGEGHADSRDAESPAKLSVYFDTPTGKKLGTKQVWITQTDYTSYAVMYSCWEETEDHRCSAKSAYAVVLQRNREPLPPATMTKVDGALSLACINPKAVKKIKHEGYCKKQQEAL